MSQDDGGSKVLQRLNETENFQVGLAAGLFEQLCLQPMLYWKNAQQQRLPFTLNPKILYRGTAASAGNLAVLTGIQFQFTGVAQKFFTGGEVRALTPGEEVIAAFTGGAISGPACCFLELTMIQQQRFGGALWSTPPRIFRETGPTGFMRGLVASTSRESIYAAGYLGILPAVNKQIQTLGVSPQAGAFLGATGAGLLCGALTQPLDTVKTCMQGDITKQTYTTFTESMKQLYREQGSIRALYRGYWWRSSNIVLDFILLNYFMELFAPVMFSNRFN